MRIGIGYDVHTFKKGRKLILGGVQLDYAEGLDGHSDADVLVHAIMDSLLGAAGLPDIGVHFPDNDMAYKDISSIELLGRVGKIIKKAGYTVVNIDTVLILEKPKISAYSEEMKKNIAGALKINKDCIGLKATTTEGLGFTGRGEGAAAHAVSIINEL
ncbi:MAG: 2-C-methyl-D-erythritol 2,4-cyclodiphosphate synthase [Actinobacteria bacterium]|nr:2-C-methyl-D-erythritol 2,4-cyclodiphosphate synthase [Actinomycetota bacterium]